MGKTQTRAVVVFVYSFVLCLVQVDLGGQLQIHFVELPKYDLSETSLSDADPLDQWAFFLARADGYDAETLERLLPDSVFQKATGVLEMISRSPEFRVLYDDRAKAELDQFSAIKDARTEGRKEGREEGREEGRTEGRTEGREEGRIEGQMVGRIGVLQQILGDEPTDPATLLSLEPSELEKLAGDLQRRLSERGHP